MKYIVEITRESVGATHISELEFETKAAATMAKHAIDYSKNATAKLIEKKD